MNSFKGYHILVVFMFFVSQIITDFKNHKSCGVKTSNFIVGGKEPERNEFPFMVSLQIEKGHFCGGSVLNERWVLTAAHCISILQILGRIDRPSDIHLIIGSDDNKVTSKEFWYGVEKWIVHGCFLKDPSDATDNDIALLKTDRNIEFGSNIRPICLPPKNTEPINENITVAGWGVYTPTMMLQKEGLPRSLQYADLKLYSEEFCKWYDSFRNVGLINRVIGKRLCVREYDSTVCRGDSGGPAFQVVNGKVYQLGIASSVSVTFPIGNKCYRSNPAFYLKTSLYGDWINQMIETHSDSDDRDITTKC